jgi:hypothetical protein
MNSISEDISKREVNLAKREAAISQALVAINIFVRILAVRFFMFLALSGAFSLSIIATNNQSTLSAAIILLYAAVTILPLTVLEWKFKTGV